MFGKSVHLLGILFHAAALSFFVCHGLKAPQNVAQTPQASLSVADTELIAARIETLVADALKKIRSDADSRTWHTRAIATERASQFSDLRTIEVTSTSQGYWLLEPKVMIAVDHLGGGDLRVKYSDRYEKIRIAQRMDVDVEGRQCFLLLVESVKGKAIFQFGCEKRSLDNLIVAHN